MKYLDLILYWKLKKRQTSMEKPRQKYLIFQLAAKEWNVCDPNYWQVLHYVYFFLLYVLLIVNWFQVVTIFFIQTFFGP